MKSAARLYAVQALFQMEQSGQTVEAVSREFLDHRFGATYDGDEMAEGDAMEEEVADEMDMSEEEAAALEEMDDDEEAIAEELMEDEEE